MNNTLSKTRLLAPLVAAALTATAYAAAPGITTTSGAYALTAQAAYISQPDGQAIYSWGYGCSSSFSPTFLPSNISGACPSMQIPGPTLIVTKGQTVTVTLTNNLPASAGNTSILFPGFQVTPSGGVAGLLTLEAPPGGSVTYTFTASTEGTHAYYSGTQSDLQIEMGLFGAIIVLPTQASIPSNCLSGLATTNLSAEVHWGEKDFRLAPAAYSHSKACYDREYLFQFSEMDPAIHHQALEQVAAANCTPVGGALPATCSLHVATEPYHPAYFMINGRSMPDDMDANYTNLYPHQPYNGNPHMHPGEQVLIRVIGQGRWQHPFHEHGNHVRILARDGNLITSATNPAANLAGPLLFTTTTTPGLAFDGIFYWTGKGLNWDPYGHHAALPAPANPNSITASVTANDELPCVPDANGYNTLGTSYTQINYYEWCQDHNKPLEAMPFGDLAGGGPATLPDPNIFTNGAWFGGSAYLGKDATLRAVGPNGVTPPSGTLANPPSTEAGYAFMWHSHNEREITTNNAFPGGMLMMMLVDSREFVIDESN